MRLRYETGIATLVQFVVGSVFIFINGLISIIGGCTSGANASCVGNVLATLILILFVIVVVLGFLLVLGYAAQERRDSRLANVLIAAETLAGLIYLFDARRSSNIIERLTSLVSFLIAVWIVVLAWRLSRAKGSRIVKTHPRRGKPSEQ